MAQRIAALIALLLLTVLAQTLSGVGAQEAKRSSSARFWRQPVPDRLVVLTFDDAVSTHPTFVAPLLKKYGFGGTFFIT